jgi:hypothetical protein
VTEKEAKPWPPLFAMLWPGLVRIAREHGYALGLHGSLARDLDILAVPWVEEASEPQVLAEAFNGWVTPYAALEDGIAGLTGPEQKCHGRLAWAITLGAGAFIDLSVTPRRAA